MPVGGDGFGICLAVHEKDVAGCWWDQGGLHSCGVEATGVLFVDEVRGCGAGEHVCVYHLAYLERYGEEGGRC